MYDFAALEAHLQRHFKAPLVRREWHSGPVHELPDDFHVVSVDQTERLGAYAWITIGMGVVRERGNDHGLELMLLAPTLEQRHLELLYATAHYHLTGTALALGDTVNWGKPWYPDADCDHALVSLPYLDGPELERCETMLPPTRVLWLLPITKAERDFKKHHGIDALEERLEAAGINYVDPFRGSLAVP